MGFDAERARAALERCGSIEAALEFLVAVPKEAEAPPRQGSVRRAPQRAPRIAPPPPLDARAAATAAPAEDGAVPEASAGTRSRSRPRAVRFETESRGPG